MNDDPDEKSRGKWQTLHTFGNPTDPRKSYLTRDFVQWWLRDDAATPDAEGFVESLFQGKRLILLSDLLEDRWQSWKDARTMRKGFYGDDA